MHLNTDRLQAAGFTEAEIKKIQEYCDAAEKAGRFSHQPATTRINGTVQLSCRTIAEIMEKLRPNCWLDKPGAEPSMSKMTLDDRMIQVHVTFHNPFPGCLGGEYLWARRIGKNTAKIENIPFLCKELACGDLVRIDKHGEILDILEHVAQTRRLRYGDPKDQSEDELRKRYAEVQEALEEHDIVAEGMFPGICSLSVPRDISDEQLATITQEVGAEVIGLDSEEE